MEVDHRSIIVLALFGVLVGFVLWAFRLIPAWGIPVAGLIAGVGIPAVVFVVLIFAWMANGSH